MIIGVKSSFRHRVRRLKKRMMNRDDCLNNIIIKLVEWHDPCPGVKVDRCLMLNLMSSISSKDPLVITFIWF